MNLEGMVIAVAQEVPAGTFAGGTEWQPPVNQMWLLKSGTNGDHNPRLVTADQWSMLSRKYGAISPRARSMWTHSRGVSQNDFPRHLSFTCSMRLLT